MFAYDPISLEQAEKEMFNLLEDGVYNFEVKTAKQRISNSGNQMISLTLLVYNHDGSTHMVFDNLIATPRWRWKIRKFCESVGLLNEYESRVFNETLCDGRSGKCKIISTIFKNKQQNSVDDYLSANVELTQPKKEIITNDEPFIDDQDLPF